MHIKTSTAIHLIGKPRVFLQRKDKSGQSILVIKAKEANPLIANFNIDNYSPSSIGSERFGVN
jgi:hemolysin activation/secretion protein